MNMPIPLRRPWQSPNSIALDMREGFVEITRHGSALLGLLVLLITLTFSTRPGLQTVASEWLMGWLTSRQDGLLAEAMQELMPEQVKVTRWLSRKYRIAPQPLEQLVAEAWQLGQISQVPPTLILAVMAVESGFNPFAKGTQGANGLMQIDPQAQQATLQAFGGRLAVFDPLTNVRIGVRLLQSSIQEAGSLREGVLRYGRASGQASEESYADRVMTEHRQLERVAGKP